MTAFDTTGTAIKQTSAATSATVDITAAAVGAWVFFYGEIGIAPNGVTFTGWSPIIEFDEGTATHHFLWQRKKQPGDTTFTVSWPTSSKMTANWISYTGLASVPTELAADTLHTAAGTAFSTPSLTPGGADRWSLTFTGARDTTASNLPDGTSWTPDAALTERVDASNAAAATSPWVAIEIADSNGIVTQAAHSYTATCVHTESHGAAILLFLVPATPPAAVASTIRGKYVLPLEQYRFRYAARSAPPPAATVTPAVPLPSSLHDQRRPPKIPPHSNIAGWEQGISQPPIIPVALRDTRRPVKIPPRSGLAQWQQGASQPPIPPTAVRDTRRPVKIPPRSGIASWQLGNPPPPPASPVAVVARPRVRPPWMWRRSSAAQFAVGGISQPPVPPQAVHAARRPPRLPPWRAVLAAFTPAPSLPAAVRDARRPPRLPPKGSAAGWGQGASQPPVPPPAGQPRPRRAPWHRPVTARPVPPQVVITPAPAVPVNPPRWRPWLPRWLRSRIWWNGTAQPPALVLFSVPNARQLWSVPAARQLWSVPATRQLWSVPAARNSSR